MCLNLAEMQKMFQKENFKNVLKRCMNNFSIN